MPVATDPLQTASAPSEANYLPRIRPAYWVVLLTIVAAALRFYSLGAKSFWEDEGYTWNFVTLPWRQYFEGLVTRAADMTVYYTIMKFWVGLGSSEFAMRSFSALCSVATVPIIAELGRRLYSRRAGLVAAGLFAVNGFAIHYAQEARSYALVMLLGALGWLQLETCLRRQTARSWLLFAFLALLQIYSHLISGLNVAAQLLTLCFLPSGTLRWRPLLRSIGVLVLGVLPALAFTLRNSSVPLEWVPRLSWKVFVGFFSEVSGSGGSRLQMAVVAAILLAVVVLFGTTLVREGRGRASWAAAVPVTGLAVPVIALMTLSHWQPVFVPRYLGFVVVPLVLGVGYFCSLLRTPSSIWLAAGLGALLLWPLPSYYRQPSTQDFRSVVDYIQLHQQPGDVLIAWRTMARPTLGYYARRGPALPKYIFPDTGPYFMPTDQDVRPDPFTLPVVVKRSDRVWIVYLLDTSPLESHYTPPLYLQRLAERTHRLISVRQFQGVRVEEYSY